MLIETKSNDIPFLVKSVSHIKSSLRGWGIIYGPDPNFPYYSQYTGIRLMFYWTFPKFYCGYHSLNFYIMWY